MITNQELIATLIVKTGLDEQTVKGQLHAWQKEVSNTLERGEEVKLHGVGVLKPQGGTIEFTPDPQLAHEVNFKYVGLAEVIQQMPEDPSKEMPSSAVKDTKTDPAVIADAIEENPKELPSAENETSSLATPTSSKTSSKKIPEDRSFDQGSPLRWVAAIVVLATAFTLLLWQLPIQRPADVEPRVESPSPSQVERPSETSPETTPETAPEASPETAPDLSDEAYGLMGSYNESLDESYTIVLYSLGNRQNALAQRDQLLEQSYRAFARERQLNSGTVTTQVCVGQFEDFDEAINAANASFGEAGINFFISAHSQPILE